MSAHKKNLLDDLFQRRDSWRERMSDATTLVKGKDLPWERNRHGKMKWYLHPGLDDRAMRSLLVFMQEIPPGGRTGKQKHQGGLTHYIIEGRGYTMLNDEKHEWGPGDCVVFPILSHGVEYQHFNSDPKRPVIFIAAQPDLFDIIGVDMGSGFEQLEDAPGSEDRQQTTD
ncbi:MAG: cupin domain-containing protein [Candidatus Binatia bacterium]